MLNSKADIQSRFSSLFATDKAQGFIPKVAMQIKTGDAKPITFKMRRLSETDTKEVETQVNRL